MTRLVFVVLGVGLLASLSPFGSDYSQARSLIRYQAADLDEVLVFDSNEPGANDWEGFIRQRLGLLDADGKPLTPGGNLPPLVSQDGKKKGFDMNKDSGVSLKDAIQQLKPDGGIVTVLTHGNTGILIVDGKLAAGFGDGTSSGDDDDCLGSPVQLDGIGAKNNVTVYLCSCRADAATSGGAKVSDSLRNEISSLGGMNPSVVASDKPVGVDHIKDWQALTPLTPQEIAALTEAIDIDLNDVPFANQYNALQAAIDAAIGPGKAKAKLEYEMVIGDTTVRSFTIPSFTSIVESHRVCANTARGCGHGKPIRPHDQPLSEHGGFQQTIPLEAQPNPFNPQTTIRYFLAQSGHVRLGIYDVRAVGADAC